MTWVKNHSKSLLALAFSLFLLIQPRLVGSSVFTAHDWDKVAIAGLALVVAYVSANTSTTVGKYAKEIALVLTAALVALDNVLDGPWSTQKLMQVIAAAVLAAGALVSSTPVQADLPPTALMDDSTAGHDAQVPEAGYGVIELAVGVLIILILAFVLIDVAH